MRLLRLISPRLLRESWRGGLDLKRKACSPQCEILSASKETGPINFEGTSFSHFEPGLPWQGRDTRCTSDVLEARVCGSFKTRVYQRPGGI